MGIPIDEIRELQMKHQHEEITRIRAWAEEDPIFAAWLDEQIELCEGEATDAAWLIRRLAVDRPPFHRNDAGV